MKEGNSTTRIRIFSCKDKMLSFPWRKWSNTVSLLPSLWQTTLGNGAISGTQCWSLLLADLALNSNCRQVSLGEWNTMLLGPCITSISTTMASLIMNPLSNDRNDWGDWLPSEHLSYLIIKLLLQQSHLWMSTGHKHHIFMFFTHLGRSTHALFPQMSFLPIFQSCSFQVSDHPTKHWLEPMNQWPIVCLVISPSIQTVTMCTAGGSAQCEDFTWPVSFSLVPRKGL